MISSRYCLGLHHQPWFLLILVVVSFGFSNAFSSSYYASADHYHHGTNLLYRKHGGATTPSRQGSELKMAWSLPSPPSMDSLSWYTEEAHVTRRRLIYEDNEPLEFKFATPLDDWPTLAEEGEEDNEIQLVPGRPRRNPIRRAIQWVRRVRQRS